ncbi:MAG: hypothetical protein C0404_07710 [Verrucomicrobia bacterium]|nr:hypothetical protein [Verrucomicrobiota bacterium]
MTGSMKLRGLVGCGAVAAIIAVCMYFAGTIERGVVTEPSGDHILQPAQDASQQSLEKVSAPAEIASEKHDAVPLSAQSGEAMPKAVSKAIQDPALGPQKTRGPPTIVSQTATSPGTPPSGSEGVVAPIDPSRVDRYASAPVLEERRGVRGPEGRDHNIKVVRVNSKYPLIRVDEAVVRDPETGKERVMARTEMVADHIVVKVKEGTTEADLQALNAKYGAKILRKMVTPGPGTYLVQLAGASVDSAPNAVAAYGKEVQLLAYAEPDYLVHTMETAPNDPSFDRLWGMKNRGQVVVKSVVSIGANTVPAYPMLYAGPTSDSGITTNIYYCNKGKTAGDFPPQVSGNIALISRDDQVDSPKTSFATKVQNAMNAGAVAAIVMNSEPGNFQGTLGAAGSWIPTACVSYDVGCYLWDKGVNGGHAVTIALLGGLIGADIHATEAWDLARGSTGVLVAVIDTGVDYSHPDLAAHMDPRGKNFFANTDDPMDDFFHGTHCAGTIGGIGNNGVGVAGVNWNVAMVGLKFMASDGSGYISDAVEAVYYATSIGVVLTSNSWGGGGPEQTLKDAIADAGDHGILFVAAAGNSASDNDQTPTYPASYGLSNIIAVAATDARDELAYFSCYGSNSVHLGAPGVSIYSTYPTYMTAEMTASGYATNYETISGTSMATPHVAGACALVKSHVPGISAQDLKGVILETADPVPSLQGVTTTGARLNVRSALEASTNSWIKIKTSGLVWDDDASGGSSGNGDGYVNPGERIGLTIPLRNVGLVGASGVTAQLLCADTNITIVAGNISYGSLPVDGEVSPSSQFLFDVRSGTVTPRQVTFTLAITTAAGQSRQENITITVYTSSSISGHVRKDGSGLAGATIKATGPIVRSITSGADGSYSLSVIDGSYSLSARYTGFADAQATAMTPPNQTVDFAFTTATVSGQVLDDASGAPVPGAKVNYLGVFSGTVTADSSGNYVVSSVWGSPGVLRLQAESTTGGVDYISGKTSVSLPPSVSGVNLRLARPQAPYYNLIQIVATNGSYECAYAVNIHGQVVGGTGADHDYTTPNSGWIWANGNFSYIPLPGDWSYDPLYTFTVPGGINEKGQIAGYLGSFFYNEAFLYRDGMNLRLGVPPGSIGSAATALNNNGVIVGSGYMPGIYGGSRRAAVWQPDLTATMISKYQSCAFGVNNAGQVVGYVKDDYGNNHAFMWHDGAMTMLDGAYSFAFGINDAGEIAASSEGHTVVYACGTTNNLHADSIWDATYPTYRHSQPTSINSLGDVVGWADAAAYRYVDLQPMRVGCDVAVVWKDGRMYALKDQVVNLNGWVLQSAQSINDNGWIAGLADKGQFLLVPTNVPPASATVTPSAILVNGFTSPGECVIANIRVSNSGSTFRQALEWSAMHDMGNTNDAGKVLRELPALATGVAGCAYDGNVIWVCGWDGVNFKTLRKVNPNTGAVVGTLDVGSACAACETLAWDGQHLWTLSSGLAICMDPVTGARLSSIPAPANASAIAWGDGALWISTIAQVTDGYGTFWWTSEKIHKVDPQTGNVLHTVAIPQVVRDTGGKYNGAFSAFAYSNGSLWLPMANMGVVQSWPGVAFRLDAVTGNLLGRFPLPSDGEYFSAMASDGNGSFWLSKSGGDKAHAFFLVSPGVTTGNWMYSFTTNGCTGYPVLGATRAGQFTDITLAFDPLQAGTGVHTGTIAIACNDPANPMIRIPVTFNVNAQGYKVTATAGFGGTITPSGMVGVPSGSNQTFSIVADSGMRIADVAVDGLSQGPIPSYTFSNVTTNHTIAASFLTASDLVLKLNLDDASGTNAVDTSGYGNNGTLINGPVWAAGKNGGAVQFDGANDYLVVNNVAANTASGGCNTVAFWMKWNGVDQRIAFRWNGSKPGQLWFYGGYFGINTANGELLGIDASGFSGNWVHVVGVFPNTVPTASNAKIYINGVQQALSFRMGTACKLMTASPQVTLSYSSSCYGGAIDDLRIYNRELNATEVAALANPVAVDAYGIPDSWKTLYFGSTTATNADAMCDADGDGMNNFQEWKAGTIPTEAGSRLLVSGFRVQGSGMNLVIQWQSVTGRYYTIQKSSNLTNGFMMPLITGIPGTGGMNTRTVAVDQACGYYRIKVE